MTLKEDKNIYDSIGTYFSGKKLSKNDFLFSVVVSLATLLIFYRIYSGWIITNAHWDLGWLRQVTWHNVFQKMPETCCSVNESNSIYISWFWHFTPLFSIVSLLSYLWPFSSFAWLALLLAIAPALLVFFTCNIFFLSRKPFSKFKAINYFYPILLSLSFGSIRAIAFPHYELYFLVFVLAAVYSAARNSKFLFFLSIIMLVFLKEDSAFYLVILIWFIFFKKLSTLHLIKTTFLLLTLPIVYLVSLNFVQLDYPINPSFPNMTNLESQYLGKPLLSHISIDFIINRLIHIFQVNFVLIMLIILLACIALLTKNDLMMRLIASTLPYFIVSTFAFSWVKGVMLNYELIPVWSSVMLAVLSYPTQTSDSNKHIGVSKVFIFLFLLLGLVNGSAKHVISVGLTQTPNVSTMNSIDLIIQEAKKNAVILDANFFVYNPSLVSYNSWLKDLNELNSAQCFIHLPTSKTKKTLAKNFPNFVFDTRQFKNSSFQVTCLQNKKSSRN
jgi:hypothetical protein